MTNLAFLAPAAIIAFAVYQMLAPLSAKISEILSVLPV